VALVLAVVTLPLQLIIAVLIRLESPGPALFVQERLGRGGTIFRMYKFRSMRWEPGAPPVLNSDGSTRVDADDQRLTRMGRFLRIGLDELPQIYNVLKGDMALIGPRPDAPFHRSYYCGREQDKLTVLPGMTGLPQALGRNELPWKERIALDLRYIDNYSLWLDMKIIVNTFHILRSRRGLFSPTRPTVRQK
jgi:lipopolysaccharide/colanic/teichoic acid biosynthesis glycosyltransferase